MYSSLNLGIARQIISPPVGGQLYGYSPDVFSTELHDDLTATAFYFRQGDCQALMITVTVCSVQTELADSIRGQIEKELGIPAGHIILAATHTHSGPNLTGNAGWGDLDRPYADGIFVPRVLEAARRAVEAAVPVRVGMAHGDSLVGINRRQLNPDNTVALGQNPWGPFNPKMTVMSFRGEDGKIIANLIHYGAHGTASGRNTEITRDWSGVMIDALESVSGGITAFFNGPEGDVGPRLLNGRTVGAQTVKDAMVHGGWAAQDAVRIFREIKEYREASLSVTEETLSIPLEKRLSREEAQRIYDKFSDQRINWGAGQKNYAKMVLDSYDAGYKDEDFRVIPQTIVRIGDAAVVSFPFELFSEIGMRIDKASSIPHVLGLSNANGSAGYFATQDALCRGGYEINMHRMAYIQPYRDNADHALVTGTLENLGKL